MLDVNDNVSVSIAAPVRQITARVELYEGSTLLAEYTQSDILKSVYLYRTGVSDKFFGFSIGQKLNVHILDKDRVLNITTANSFKVYFAVNGSEEVDVAPMFHVTETHRNETTGELSITAYDALDKGYQLTVNDLALTPPYTVRDFIDACADAMGLNQVIFKGLTETDSSLSTSYESGANFEGTETVRDSLVQAAEVTQTVCFVNPSGALVLCRPDKDGEPVFAVTKHDYIELETSDNRRLGTVFHATELGDNVSASIAASGTTQYIRDNPFWDLREDIGTLVDNALAAVGGLTIGQFRCYWRGSFALEPCDKIQIETRDGSFLTSFVYDDVITYDGTYSHDTGWSYEEDVAETATNATNLGDMLKQTYARVDKVNKEISLVTSQVNSHGSTISQIQMDTQSITQSVQKVETRLEETAEGMADEISTLTEKVSTQITAEDVSIQIESALEQGVDKVTTSTGFTFNEEGMTVSKSDSELSTIITEDGMRIMRKSTEVLTADNQGVKARNLQATTYLIIGKNSRFEDYNRRRTGCFWIGN